MKSINKIITYDVVRIKSILNHSTSGLNQRIVFQLLNTGVFERHLLKFRLEMNKNLNRYTALIRQHFTDRSKITQPPDGCILE